MRSRSELTIDVTTARAVAQQSVLESEPGASVLAVQVNGAVVTVTTEEAVTLPFNFLPAKAIKLEARASARLVRGYDSPSSRLPLPTSTF